VPNSVLPTISCSPPNHAFSCHPLRKTVEDFSESFEISPSRRHHQGRPIASEWSLKQQLATVLIGCLLKLPRFERKCGIVSFIFLRGQTRSFVLHSFFVEYALIWATTASISLGTFVLSFAWTSSHIIVSCPSEMASSLLAEFGRDETDGVGVGRRSLSSCFSVWGGSSGMGDTSCGFVGRLVMTGLSRSILRWLLSYHCR